MSIIFSRRLSRREVVEMAFQLVKAQRESSPLKLGIFGVAGAGKTFTALTLATGLGGKIAVIDSEGGASAKYGDRFDFQVGKLTSYKTDAYMAALSDVERAGFKVCVVDSLSDAWDSKDGLVQEQQMLEAKGTMGMLAWGKVKAKAHALTSAIRGSQMHVICTFRAKDVYAASEGNKRKMERTGLGPVFDKEVAYEFDVFASIGEDQTFSVIKTRYTELNDCYVNRPGADFGTRMAEIVATGKPREQVIAEPESPVDEREVAAAARISAVVTKAALIALGPELKGLRDVISQEAYARLTVAYNAKGKDLPS